MENAIQSSWQTKGDIADIRRELAHLSNEIQREQANLSREQAKLRAEAARVEARMDDRIWKGELGRIHDHSNVATLFMITWTVMVIGVIFLTR